MIAAVQAMTPEQRDAFIAQMQQSGARFVLGAFGKDVPPPQD